MSGPVAKVTVLLAVTGRPYEPALLAALDRQGSHVTVARRCMDVVDLLASTATTTSGVAVVSSRLHRLDGGALARLAASGVASVAVVEADDEAPSLLGMGAAAVVRAPAPNDSRAAAAFAAELIGEVLALRQRPEEVTEVASEPPAAGRLVAVWGPCGSPGRTTVAVTVADELSRLGTRTLLADADTYGPSVAQRLGILDEASGVAAAARLANTGTLASSRLEPAARALPSGLSVLTGLTRADRWPELPGSALRSVWQAARSFADVTVVDCGFCLEEDDELSYDSVVARRNAATLVTLESADALLVVGGTDVVGVARLVRGMHELADLAERRPGAVPTDRRVVLNRMPLRGRRADRRVGSLARLDPDGSFATARTVPDDPESCGRSIDAGRTLAEVAARSPAREALRALALGLTARKPA